MEEGCKIIQIAVVTGEGEARTTKTSREGGDASRGEREIIASWWIFSSSKSS